MMHSIFAVFFLTILFCKSYVTIIIEKLARKTVGAGKRRRMAPGTVPNRSSPTGPRAAASNNSSDNVDNVPFFSEVTAEEHSDFTDVTVNEGNPFVMDEAAEVSNLTSDGSEVIDRRRNEEVLVDTASEDDDNDVKYVGSRQTRPNKLFDSETDRSSSDEDDDDSDDEHPTEDKGNYCYTNVPADQPISTNTKIANPYAKPSGEMNNAFSAFKQLSSGFQAPTQGTGILTSTQKLAATARQVVRNKYNNGYPFDNVTLENDLVEVEMARIQKVNTSTNQQDNINYTTSTNVNNYNPQNQEQPKSNKNLHALFAAVNNATPIDITNAPSSACVPSLSNVSVGMDNANNDPFASIMNHNLFKPIQNQNTNVAGLKTTGLNDDNGPKNDASFYKNKKTFTSVNKNNPVNNWGVVGVNNNGTSTNNDSTEQTTVKDEYDVNFFLLWAKFGDKHCYFLIGTYGNDIGNPTTSWQCRIIMKFLEAGKSKFCNEKLAMNSSNIFNVVDKNLKPIIRSKKPKGADKPFDAEVHAFNFFTKDLLTMTAANNLVQSFIDHMKDEACNDFTGKRLTWASMGVGENFYQHCEIAKVIGINQTESLLRRNTKHDYERNEQWALAHLPELRSVYQPCTWTLQKLRHFNVPVGWLHIDEVSKLPVEEQESTLAEICECADYERALCRSLCQLWENRKNKDFSFH